MIKYNEDELNKNIKQNLDDSVDSLDANTLSSIRQVRANSIEKVEARKKNHWQGYLVGGLATACVMVLAVMLLLNHETPVQPVPVEDLELISSSDNLELFEDLEFYEWLEEDGLTS